MFQLTPDTFSRASALFAPLDIHLAVAAALRGATPGRLWVDNPISPRAGLLWVSHRFYLAGDPTHAAFNTALRAWLADEVFPAHPEGVYTLYFMDPAWQSALDAQILPDRPTILIPREYYALSLEGNPTPPAPINLPEGLELRPVDADLVAQTELVNHADLLEEMQSERTSVEEFLQRSFGTVVIDRPAGALAGWCLSEYNLEGHCEVGIGTLGDYQRKGLATAAGLAFAEQARAAGIQEIGWHCWMDNRPSSATARKLGYRKVCDCPGGLLFANLVIHWAVLGDIRLNAGDYAGALAGFQGAFQRGEAPGWAYLRAACAAARAGETGLAFEYLEEARKRGGLSVERVKAEEHLESLRGLPEWEEFVKRFD